MRHDKHALLITRLGYENIEDVKFLPVSSKMKDLTGKNLGHAIVVGYIGKICSGKSHRQIWLAVCRCGVRFPIQASATYGNTKSCGCWCSERSAEHGRTILKAANTKHGLSTHPLYDAWDAMIKRCYNEKDKDYKNYGARGIKVCERWLPPMGIVSYVSDVGIKPDGASLDRIDVNGDYCPENCRWALHREQNLNTRNNLDIPNVYLDGSNYKAVFQWKGEKYYLGMFYTREAAASAIQHKLKELGWADEALVTTT